MPVDISNGQSSDLDELYRQLVLSTQSKTRANRELPEEIILTDSEIDRELVFEYFRNATTYIADRTSLYTTITVTKEDGSTEQVNVDRGAGPNDSGAGALRRNFLERNITDIEVIDFNETTVETKRTLYYQYIIDALKHRILWEYYQEMGFLDLSRVEFALCEDLIRRINNVGFRPTFVKAKATPQF